MGFNNSTVMTSRNLDGFKIFEIFNWTFKLEKSVEKAKLDTDGQEKEIKKSTSLSRSKSNPNPKSRKLPLSPNPLTKRDIRRITISLGHIEEYKSLPTKTK